MESHTQRVVIAHQQALCRAGLAALLGDVTPASEIVQTSNLSHMIAAIAQAPTTMVTVGFSLPGLGGTEGLRRLRATYPLTLLVVIAESREREVALEALGAGVHGYILKDAPADEIIRAFNSIRSGGIYVPSLVSEISVQRSSAVPAFRSPHDATMTDRQLEVLEMVAAGHSNKVIARSLQIAEGTVKVHITAAFRALGVHNRVSAAVALRKQLSNDDARPDEMRNLSSDHDRRIAPQQDLAMGRHTLDGPHKRWGRRPLN